MALDKLVDSALLDADLTSVANAIRTKGGTSASLAFPADFVSAINSISTGVTPTGTKQISITSNGTTTEDVTNYASVEIEVNVSGGGATPLVVTLTEDMQGMLVAMDKTVGEIFDAVYAGQHVIFVHDYGSDKICYVAIGAVHRATGWNVVYMMYNSAGNAVGYATAQGASRTGHYTFDNPYGSGGL